MKVTSGIVADNRQRKAGDDVSVFHLAVSVLPYRDKSLPTQDISLPATLRSHIHG